jgi:hypothetical protein
MVDTIKVNPQHYCDFKGIKVGGVLVTATPAEINAVDGAPLSMSTSATPASGACAVQLVFKDAAGVAMAVPVSGLLYLSEAANGLAHHLADTSLAVLTNGALTNLGSAGPSLFTTTAEREAAHIRQVHGERVDGIWFSSTFLII